MGLALAPVSQAWWECVPAARLASCGSGGSISLVGLPVKGRALQDTTPAWCKEWTCWLVRFGVAVETCCLSFQLKSPVKEKPDLHPSHTTSLSWGLVQDEQLREVASIWVICVGPAQG